MKNYYIYNVDGFFVVEYDNKKAVVSCEEFSDKLLAIINGGGHVYLWEGPLFLESMLSLFKRKGFKCVDPSTKIKEAGRGIIRPLICDDFDVIRIDIVTKQGKSAKIYNADRITKEKDPELLKEIQKYGSQKKPQCTMPSICRYAWERWGKNTPFIIRQKLPDAKNIELENGETVEDYCRRTYRGAFLYMNAETEKKYENVYVYDFNSMYTYIMMDSPMPVGLPEFCEGGPSDATLKNSEKGLVYYFVHIKTKFKLKKEGIPSLRLNFEDVQRWYHERDYMTTSKKYNQHTGYGKDEALELWLTQQDWELLQENYNLSETEMIDHIWFLTDRDLFKSYNKYFYKMKTENDGIRKQVGKNFNNFLSGTMARKIKYKNAVPDFSDPIFDEETGEIYSDYSFKFTESEGGRSMIYVGSAITAYGRRLIIDLIKKNRDRWLYTDTDSIHVIGKGLKGAKIHESALGSLKVEHVFDNVFYYAKKRYMGYDRQAGRIDGAFAGLSDHDKGKFLKTLNMLYNTREEYKGKDGDIYFCYEPERFEELYKLLSFNSPFSLYSYDFDNIYCFEFDKMMKKLNGLKIMTTIKKCEDFRVERVSDTFIKVEDLGYKFL